MTAPPPRLSLPIKLGYGLGEVAEGVKSATLETFLFFYYVQVLGLPGSLAGLALLIAVLVDAVADPVIGTLSDNLHTRLGRRHPFLYAAPIPLGLALVLLFAPPAGLSHWGLFAWLLAFTSLGRVMQSFYFVPHMALGADLSDDFDDRVAVSAWRNIFGSGGRLLILALAFSLFFKGTAAHPGQLDASAYLPLAATCAGIAGVVILVSALTTQRRAIEREVTIDRPATSAGVVTSLTTAFRLPAFSIFFVANLISYVLSGVQAALALHLFTFYWRLPPAAMQWVLSSLTIGVLIGSFLVRPLASRWDKKPLLVASVLASVLIATLPIVLAEAGWLQTSDKDALARMLFGFSLVAGISGGAALVLPGAMLADISDAYELRFGRRIEGFLFGASAFTRKAALGCGGAIAGVALDLVRFPRGASVAAVDHATALKVALLYGPAMTVVTVVSMAIMWRYPLDRAAHRRILEELAARRV